MFPRSDSASAVATLLAGVLLGSAAAAQQVGGEWERVARVEGDVLRGSLGAAVAGCADLDGDGVGEILVGGANAVRVYSGASGALLLLLNGASPGQGFGRAVADAGDVDADGVHDIVVGAPSSQGYPSYSPGSVYVYSGATGALLYQFDGTAQDSKFGDSVDGAGDVNGDGHADLIVGAPYSFGGSSGAAYVFSGATGAVLHQAVGLFYTQFGRAVAGAGDVDGDGHGDVLIGIPGDGHTLHLSGSAILVSGATGSVIRRFVGSSWGDSVGEALADAGDVNGDGVPDQVIGAPGTRLGALRTGSAAVYCGATGALLHTFPGTINSRMGSSVSCAGDFDGDGLDDVLVGAQNALSVSGQMMGSVFLYSGDSGALLNSFTGTTAYAGFGASIASPGDLDGDRIPEILIATPWETIGGLTWAGSVEVYSLDPYLHVDATTISLGLQQTVDLKLDFPGTEAGQRYAILPSISGSGPSSFAGIAIPVTQDPVFFMMLGRASVLGRLNGSARATHPFKLPHRTPGAAVGQTLSFAAMTFEPSTGLGRLVSAVRHLAIVH